MKNNKGITLISLTITIILIIILAGTITYSGIHVYENMLVENFIAEMKLAQDKVNLICDKYKVSGKSNINEYLESENIKTEETSFGKAGDLNEGISKLLDGKNKEEYLYFDKQLLDSKLGIKNLEQKVLINFVTREVISLKGVKYNGKMCYTQYELPNGDKTVIYNPENSNLGFTIEKKIYGLNAKINVKIPSDSDVVKVYYGEQLIENGEKKVLYWNEVEKNLDKYEINIIKTADYVIKVETSEGKTSQIEQNVTLVNNPSLSSELIPIKYNENNKKWVITSYDSGTWYDYKPTDSAENVDTSKWANAMLSDGNYKNVNGVIKYCNPETGEETVITSEIEIEDVDLGSIFVWIPRYMYQIEEGMDESSNVISNSGYNTAIEGNINIKFLKGTTDLPTDDKPVKISSVPGNGNWLVHPAFKNGAENYYSNGEWDQEITGIWVAKFETSKREDNEYRICANVKPDNNSIFSEVFTKSKQFKRDHQSHLMKNSEYSAATYLAYSIYGINKKNIVIDESENLQKFTGYDYKNNYASTTTGNIYGIYDLNGVSSEYMSAIIKADSINETGLLQETSNLKRSSKYITIYDNIINKNNYGDSISEISNTEIESLDGYEYWNKTSILSKYPTTNYPLFIRPSMTGLFGYGNAKYITSDNISELQEICSRIVLILK